jgi:hypothetical protein
MSDTNSDRVLVRTTTHVVMPEGVPVQTNHFLAEIVPAAGVAVTDLAAAIAAGAVAVSEIPEG